MGSYIYFISVSKDIASSRLSSQLCQGRVVYTSAGFVLSTLTCMLVNTSLTLSKFFWTLFKGPLIQRCSSSAVYTPKNIFFRPFFVFSLLLPFSMLKNAFKKYPPQNRTNVQIKGGGGQRPFEQCSKKLHFFEMGASLSTTIKDLAKCAHLISRLTVMSNVHDFLLWVKTATS